MKKQIRFLSLILCFIMLFSILCSCAPRPLAQSKLAKTEVGKVVGGSEEYIIDYEEFYPLAYDFYQSAKAKYGDDTEAIEKEVWDNIKEKIIINSAIIELCKSEGLEYDESELRDRVNDFIEREAITSFDGDCGALIDEYEEKGITDHYIRFCAGVDILYGDLALKYQKNGTVPSTDEAVKDYVKENFLHTWHVAIYVDEGDDRDVEYAKAEAALADFKSNKNMLSLIGSKYNEDTNFDSLTNVYGHYFQKDVCPWGNEYSKAAENSSYSSCTEIITTQGISPSSGQEVECFYIIQKLPITKEEIENNFTTLSDTVKNSIVSKKLDDTIKKLSFEPNDYAKNLDFANLEIPKNGIDYQLVIGICIGVGALVLLVCAILVFRSVRAKRFQKKLREKKNLTNSKKK